MNVNTRFPQKTLSRRLAERLHTPLVTQLEGQVRLVVVKTETCTDIITVQILAVHLYIMSNLIYQFQLCLLKNI